MARSNKPIVWFPFAAGGTVAAFMAPVLIAVTGLLVPLGVIDLSYDKVYAFASHILGKLILLGVFLPILWHAAHRFRMTVQDLGVRSAGPRRLVALSCYGFAGLFSVVLVVALFSLW